jgi:MFS family permease
VTDDEARPQDRVPPDRPERTRWLGSVLIDTRPLRSPAFRNLWVSTAVTAIGSQFSAVAVPKQIYDLTGSSAYVGLTGAVGLVVLIVFGLWGGAIADAVDRRTVMAISNLGIVVSTVLLWLQAAAGLDSVAIVLVLFGVQQSFAAVNAPTRSAAIARVVPTSQLVAANALGFTVFTFGAVFGPLVAGVLIPLTGLATLYIIDSAALTIALVMVLRLPRMPPLEHSTRTAGLRDIVAGLKYLSAHGVLLVSFLVDMIAMVAGMPKALFPEMAEQTFGDPHGGGTALGWLYAGIPLGAFGIGLLSGRLSRIRRNGVVVTFAIAIWGAAMIGFGLSRVLWLAVVFLAIGGAADMISGVHRGAILQAASTDEMRGRIQGVFMVVVAGGPRLADVVHGWAAAVFGTTWAAAGGGVLVIVLLAITVAMVPAFWRYTTPR